jgi:TPR repeat protein
VPPSAGPSFLGLNQPFTDGPNRNDSTGTSRDQPFFGSDSFFEPDEPRVGARRIVILLVLLVALGAGGWWAFSHYDKTGAVVGTNSQTSATKPDGTETAANNLPANAKSSTEPSSSPEAASSQPEAAPTAQSKTPSPAPGVNEKIGDEKATQAPPAAAKPAVTPHPTQNIVSARRSNARESKSAALRPPTVAPTSDDHGDAAFHKGEAYLYGRGLPENCDEAVKNLKAASAKQNAKARSAFGTMYATGHCVPRDLPTSYSWFALALRADPNNQILEKDLVAVWNQMTPPERQAATRMKQ